MRDKDMMDGDQPIINVEIEIVQKKKSLIDKKTIEKDVDIWIRKQEHVPNGIMLTEFINDRRFQVLIDNVEYIKVCEDKTSTTHIPSVNISYKCYKLVSQGPETEEICQEG